MKSTDKWRLVLPASGLLLVATSICVACAWRQLVDTTIRNAPEHYENLSVDEAQQIVLGKLQLPKYVPKEVDPDPQLKYVDLWSDGSFALALTFTFRDSAKTAFELRQWGHQGSAPSCPDAVYLKDSWVAWRAHGIDVEQLEGEISYEVTREHKDDIEIVSIAIAGPDLVTGTIAAWTVSTTTIHIYSVLSVSDTLEIAVSI